MKLINHNNLMLASKQREIIDCALGSRQWINQIISDYTLEHGLDMHNHIT